MARIVMIGTVHIDPKGPSYLERALKTEQPDAITLERGPKFFRYFTSGEYGRDIRHFLNALKQSKVNSQDLKKIRLYFKRTSDFETRTAVAYGNEHRIPVLPIDAFGDAPDVQKYRDLASGDTVEERMIRLLLEEADIKEDFDAMYTLFAECYEGRPREGFLEHLAKTEGKVDHGLREGRDATPAQYLHEIAAQCHNNEKIVHIGGLAHLLDDKAGHTLYERIKDLKPVRRTLRSY